MRLQTVDFHGMVKWLVTDFVIFVDPLYIVELATQLDNKPFNGENTYPA